MGRTKQSLSRFQRLQRSYKGPGENNEVVKALKSISEWTAGPNSSQLIGGPNSMINNPEQIWGGPNSVVNQVIGADHSVVRQIIALGGAF